MKHIPHSVKRLWLSANYIWALIICTTAKYSDGQNILWVIQDVCDSLWVTHQRCVDDQIIPKELCVCAVSDSVNTESVWSGKTSSSSTSQNNIPIFYTITHGDCAITACMSHFSRINLLSSRIVMMWAFGISSASTGYFPAAGRCTSLSNSIVFWTPHIITTSKVMSNAWNNLQGCCSSFILLICQFPFQSGSGSYGKLTPQALFLLLGVMESWGSSAGAVSGPQCNAKGVKTRNGASWKMKQCIISACSRVPKAVFDCAWKKKKRKNAEAVSENLFPHKRRTVCLQDPQNFGLKYCCEIWKISVGGPHSENSLQYQETCLLWSMWFVTADTWASPAVFLQTVKADFCSFVTC